MTNLTYNSETKKLNGTDNNKSEIFEDILEKFVSRRHFLKASAAMAVTSVISACDTSKENTDHEKNIIHSDSSLAEGPPSNYSLTFNELEHGLNENIAVAKNYKTQVLVRWGDPIFDDAKEFNPLLQTKDSQLKQFGFNNDFIGFVSHPDSDKSSTHGLLVVNHEYTNPSMMFPGSPLSHTLNLQQTEVDITAHGLSVVEIQQAPNTQQWQINKSSRYNRRITPETPMEMTGPAKGSDRLKTIISKDGVHTLGTYGNCAGGVTPWGTILTGEENVDRYFSGNPKKTDEAENYQRFGMKTGSKSWGKHFPRWDLATNPNEPLHVGWIVEIDPTNPQAKPKKCTALGRCKHEGCNVYITQDNHVVAYTGDDQRFEYIYKFVSKNQYTPDDRENNLSLLDEGTLYVARFDSNGDLIWLPLVYGAGPLTPENGFNNQGDVVIDVRKAADLMGATPMDRPEDIEVNPVNGRVYAMLTNNSKRKKNQIDSANPRAYNDNGQVIEFWPENGNHAELKFKWDLFLLAGNPDKALTKYNQNISDNGWLSCPDNCAFDNFGNLWIATDGAQKQGIADGLWATEVSGEQKALTKHFFRTPKGAELCGPFFTPDNTSLFVSIQHPGSKSSYDAPSTRWPDFNKALPPRPSVVVITHNAGGVIGK